MTNSVCIETKELKFSYPDGPPVLHGISATINRGDFVAVIGQNGSGKTTLAKHFNGLLRPNCGEVCLFGESIADKQVSDLAQHVGYVFQNPDHQIFSATVREELNFGPRNLGLDKATVDRRTDAALEYFALTSVADRQPAVLGFGLRRKVSIASVYSMQTPVLILDEPTSGLDLKSTNDLMKLVGELNRLDHTIVIITHDMRIVAEYVPRCMVIRAGEIVAYDTTREIFRHEKLLRETQISLPQISELGKRMTAHGMRDDVLTVSEFCEAYSGMLATATEGNRSADNH
jgi:energy-coupling factor transport system ATP-binding protein